MITIINIPNGAVGWIVSNKELQYLFLGKNKPAIKSTMKKLNLKKIDKTDIPGFIQMVEKYFLGELIDFSRVSVDLTKLSSFSRKVLTTLQKEVGYGERITYGDLAIMSGFSNRHSRAIGQVMRNNRIPIIIPCHRVVKGDNSLGGFSAGLDIKESLLKMEFDRIQR